MEENHIFSLNWNTKPTILWIEDNLNLINIKDDLNIFSKWETTSKENNATKKN
jgi:hypothetical protein